MKIKLLQFLQILLFGCLSLTPIFAQNDNMTLGAGGNGTVIKNANTEIKQFTSYGLLNLAGNFGTVTTWKTYLCIGQISIKTYPSNPNVVSYLCNGHHMPDDKSRSYADLLLSAKTAEASITLELALAKLKQIEDKVNENTSANDRTRQSIEQVNKTFMEQLHKSISKRFDTLPAEILNNPTFKAEIERIKKEILDEVKPNP